MTALLNAVKYSNPQILAYSNPQILTFNIHHSSFNMKNRLLHLVFCSAALLFTVTGLHAQNDAEVDKYTLNFRKTMLNLDSSWANMAKMRETTNQFERLANFKKDDWLPRYYHALCLIQQSWSASAQERPIQLKAAEASIKAADALSPNNSEIVTLEGYLYYAMILIDPMSNGPVYVPKSTATFQKAMQLDPTNPRPPYLMGQNTYFTPDQWGGGMENAKPNLLKAKALFDTFKPASEFHPNWGKVVCEMILDGKMPRQ